MRVREHGVPGVGGCLHLRGRKLQDGKRTKVDPQLISNSQRTKTAAEGSGPDLRKPGADFRWVELDTKVGLSASDQNKSKTKTSASKARLRVCPQVQLPRERQKPEGSAPWG